MTSLPFRGTPQFLIVSHDVIGAHMAGPGVRYFHLARVLSAHTPTMLAVPHTPPEALAQENFSVVGYKPGDWTSLAQHVKAAKVCLIPGDLAHQFPQFTAEAVHLVVDGYDPLLAEWLALPPTNDLDQQMEAWHNRWAMLNRQYVAGDFYLCASERQRDWWLGLLEASGRINPATVREDPSLRRLVDVVPYGLPQTPLTPTGAVVKGKWRGIAPTDKVLLWGGGLWPWLDPMTAIQAVAQLAPLRPDFKLVFPGTRHPNPSVAGMPTAAGQARQLADALGLTDQAVFFGDWVPYAEWPNVLAESDLALTLHLDTLETRLAFRSRLLDYLWAGLPVVATGGDATSELVAHFGVGVVVGFGDVQGVASAIQQLLAEPRGARRKNFTRAQKELTWERAAAPLIAYCRNPWRAADRRLPSPLSSPALALERMKEELEQARLERDRWRNLAEAYEQGRFIRFMKWLKQYQT